MGLYIKSLYAGRSVTHLSICRWSSILLYNQVRFCDNPKKHFEKYTRQWYGVKLGGAERQFNWDSIRKMSAGNWNRDGKFWFHLLYVFNFSLLISVYSVLRCIIIRTNCKISDFLLKPFLRFLSLPLRFHVMVSTDVWRQENSYLEPEAGAFLCGIACHTCSGLGSHPLLHQPKMYMLESTF